MFDVMRNVPKEGGCFEVIVNPDTKEIKRLEERKGIILNTPCLVNGDYFEISKMVEELQQKIR